MTVLFGIRSCDTCRKALGELKARGQDVVFRDIRETPLTGDEIASFLSLFGDGLINRRSTTWRQFEEAEKLIAPSELLMRHPTLMKRPLVKSARGTTLGWDATARAVHLG